MAEYADTSLSLGVLIVAGSALALRLVSLPLLLRAQRAVRERAAAVREGRTAPTGGSAAALGELVTGLGGGLLLVALLPALRGSLPGFDLLAEPLLWGEPFALSLEFGIPLATARTCFLGGGACVLALWLLLWFLTQRILLGSRGGSGDRASRPATVRLVVLPVLGLLVGLAAPVGLALGALVFQLVALMAGARPRAARDTAAPLTPLVPPFVPSRPAHPVTYVPTQTDPAAAAMAAAAAPQIACRPLHPDEPQSLAGYRLLGRIGAGGMGTVYLARRKGAATQVALKTIHPELLHHAELLLRFEREVEVLSMVSGAYTARVLDAGVDAGRPYLAMELLDGRPLDVHLRERGPIGSPQALRALALALAVALSGVHRLGLVHRDKPANIMLTTAGPRLLDFGIAALVDGTRLTRTGGGPGTLTYMAPEQFGDEPVGTAADVWAWACCVVCAAHGTSPFSATSTGAVIRRIVDTGPEPAALAAVRALDPALAAAVERALAVDPAGRPADGAALVELLTAHREERRPLPDPRAVRDQITQGWRTLAL
ncbi:serine/threonine-protein kinase [Streptomyces sp. A0592]|uniref:serine/threonine-protein kinase n=1 Tax=Streptomyces sp. A0592 TaxID=2563099 RepID=UPI00109E8F93|nr:serine/threonine-protein kinase [Streptomyces sp. A0592]THA86713.1 serine/threonine protein kinase [Streptomyces sp. A0592]